MPSYKTHSIHSELVYHRMSKGIPIDLEDLKTFAMGPDTLISTDKKTFKIAHRYNVREYYLTLLKTIKNNKLLDNSEAMAFLYGQLDHFVLDAVTHPLIYYMTAGETLSSSIGAHGLCELWIDDYIMRCYGQTDIFYYEKNGISDSKVKELITEVYEKVYNANNAGKSYDRGIKIMNLFDTLVRRNLIGIVPIVSKLTNMGDIVFKEDTSRVEKYLNNRREVWYNPETLDPFTDSFADLFEKSVDISLETINDVNKYLYDGEPLKNSLILNNTSYNTGINCDLGQHFSRVRVIDNR